MVKTPWHGKTRENDLSVDFWEDPPAEQSKCPVDHDADPGHDYPDARPPQSLYRPMCVRGDEEEE